MCLAGSLSLPWLCREWDFPGALTNMLLSHQQTCLGFFSELLVAGFYKDLLRSHPEASIFSDVTCNLKLRHGDESYLTRSCLRHNSHSYAGQLNVIASWSMQLNSPHLPSRNCMKWNGVNFWGSGPSTSWKDRLSLWRHVVMDHVLNRKTSQWWEEQKENE